jgi:hypothetical protein
MLECICPAETDQLLDDLLEVSAAHYHRCVAAIQKAFADQWFEVLHQKIGAVQIENADANPAAVEEQVVRGLESLYHELRAKERGLILEQRGLRAERDRNIRAYVASRTTPCGAAA